MSRRYPGVHPDKKRGTHRAQFEVNGQIYSQRGFGTEKAAAEWIAARKAEVLQGYGVGGRGMTFAQFVDDEFLPARRAKVKQGGLRSSTLTQNESDLRRHLVPAFGKLPLSEIDVREVERLGHRLSQRGLSNWTVKRVLLTLGVVLKLARKYRYIAFNPVTDADKPTVEPSRASIPTLDQVYAVADATPNRETRALILFVALSGCRKSEAFGLRWANVDLTDGDERVRIVEQVYQGEWVDQTKTRAGSREILLAAPVVEVLRELAVAQQVDDRPNPHGLVFPSPRGGPWLATNWDRRVWIPAREAVGLPDLKLHTLRSFYTSHVRAQGLPVSITEQLVGHVDERTHRGYTRPIAGSEPMIREALARAFRGGEGS